jgi:hypothetical protein
LSSVAAASQRPHHDPNADVIFARRRLDLPRFSRSPAEATRVEQRTDFDKLRC